MKAPFFFFTLCMLFQSWVGAGNWPMYRQDSGRRGVSSEPLPEPLRIAWSRQLPELSPAFHHPRLLFDAGYEPVAADGMLVVASSARDSVTAFEGKSGKQRWKFYADGPIRMAPAIWKGLVCFGSDDGFVYCLELKSGELRWKHRVVPSERRLLGNRRLISVWPVRGGPAVDEGCVYFAAGVWPFEGVFVCAMEIESGKILWLNDRLGYLFGQQPHNTQAIGGLAPQGYLVIDGDELIVPCSTAYPARLNRYTGELIDFQLPAPGRLPGGWFAALDPDQARAMRRGKLTFDGLINRQQHEDKIYTGRGVAGLSREIRVGEKVIKFDQWREKAGGEIHSMMVADGRMYVARKDGCLICFCHADRAPEGPVRHWDSVIRPLQTSNDAAEMAVNLVDQAPGKHGLAVVIGIDDGDLTKALIQAANYQVVAIDDDPARVMKLREEFEAAGLNGEQAAVIQSDLDRLQLPPYVASILTSERADIDCTRLLQTLRPFGGVAVLRDLREPQMTALQPGNFRVEVRQQSTLVRRVGPLPGATEYPGNWAPSPDALVRFPLGVLWFDDTLAHFKRSPQPRFADGVMISQPKDWHRERSEGDSKTDYPLLPAVLSDIYTGRVLDESERKDLRAELRPTSPSVAEPNQYRPPRQKDAWKPEAPSVGQRVNPLTGESEPRSFPKTYGCDGGVNYGDFYTLRSGTAAFYDKTLESGTVFLSGPRSGCTNSIIPSGGLLNVPYFFDGCTCSYPLPVAMSLVAMPETHEQWSSWGESEIAPQSIQRVGINFGAPGDRMTRGGTLWLDYPSVGGPSPKVRIETTPDQPDFRYRHSLWIQNDSDHPWVSSSAVEGLRQLELMDLKPGRYTVRMYFAELDDISAGQRVQTLRLQDQVVLEDLDIVSQADGNMKGWTVEFQDVEVDTRLHVELTATEGKTMVSGFELRRQ